MDPQENKEIPDEKSEEKNSQPFIEFKKPVLIGKVGKLPRKIIKTDSDNDLETSSTSRNDSEKDNSKNVGSTDEPTPEKKSNTSNLPPTTLLKEQSIPLPYKEPKWSGLAPADSGYSFEVLKSGIILETIDLTKKPFYVFGRLSVNDVVSAHPTISRHHAVIQYKAHDTESSCAGFYLYDLGSSHGSFVNRTRVKPKHYVPLRVGYLVKLGCSTRQYILQGPSDDQEDESELSLTEMRRLKEEKILERKNELKKLLEEREESKAKSEPDKKNSEEDGITWGMGEDADEETDLSENPYAKPANEELYLDDPKKTLRGFFEREGCVLEYDCQERGVGQFVCRVELPIEDARGNAVIAEVIHKGKKKDAVVQCALEACRIIDRQGLLRQAKHESRKRKAKDWKEDDYYDSDDDTFLDRTGTVEKKREVRMKKFGQDNEKTDMGEHSDTGNGPLTYAGLLDRCSSLQKEIDDCENRLSMLRQQGKPSASSEPSGGEEDALDQFMNNLSDHKSQKAEISKTKLDLQALKIELAKMQRLAEIAKPADLPALVQQSAESDTQKKPIVKKTNTSVIIGKRIKLKNKEQTQHINSNLDPVDEAAFVEEVDSDEEDQSKSNKTVEKVNVINKKSIKDKTLSRKTVTDTEGDVKNDEDSSDKGTSLPMKVFGPMRPPTNYVVPDSYFENENDRDLPEIMEED